MKHPHNEPINDVVYFLLAILFDYWPVWGLIIVAVIGWQVW